MTLFQEGNTVSNNKLIFHVALKTIIIKYSKYNFSNNTYIFTTKYHNLSIIKDKSLV